ncbi:PAS/PAC sensor protein [Salinarchaeum sp. Harcht-Bsk1]|uniref:bacterio-opsin activator domain-containing protein n=1 Tax=Salinarchaeum sp. Harcht-Bsk1 TaxID=1333523 RepID=UPI00034243B2|nr:bacterio-opsin activator domain-containing protein [Salinarchaeum sp. Harcht-Bsk1]AGN01076.1 PAS/PAC sensor protein [Salinarchaeum sp. Harcht-Bsk1]
MPPSALGSTDWHVLVSVVSLGGMAATSDVERLIEGVERVAAGDYDVAFELERDDELGRLASALEEMTAAIATRKADPTDADEPDPADREDELHRYARHFEAVFNDPNLLAVILDPDGTLREINDRAMGMIDADRESVLGEPFWETPWWEGDEALQAEIRSGIERAATHDEYVEYVADHDETETAAYTSEGVIRPVSDASGNVESLVVSARDITERREREEELREARDRLTKTNRALERLYQIGADRDASLEEKIQTLLDLGRERLDLSGGYLSSIDPEDDRFEFVQTSGLDTMSPGTVTSLTETYCNETITTGEVFAIADAPAEGWGEHPAYQRWGSAAYIGGRVYVEGELAGTLAFVDDDPAPSGFTAEQYTFVDLATQWVGYELERRRKSDRLVEYTSFIDDVLDTIEDVFYVVGPDSAFERWNQSLGEATGFSEEEIEGMEPLDFIAPEDRDALASALDEAYETGSARMEARVLTKDGEKVRYDFLGSVLEDPDGNEVLVGIGRDVSERAERQYELKRTKYLLDLAQRIAHVGGWELDVRSKPYVFEATDEFYRIHGATPADHVDVETVREFYHSDERRGIDRVMADAIENGESYDMEVRLATDGRGRRWVRAIGEPVTSDGEIVAVRGSVQDITEQKEQELTLESLHELSRGLLEVDSRPAVAARVRDAAVGVLDMPCVAVYLFEESTGRLEPAAVSEAFETVCRDEGVGFDAEDDSLVWESYVSGEAIEIDDPAQDNSPILEASDHAGMLVPIGEYGVLLLASGRDAPDADDRRLAETLVATMETALQRLDNEVALRSQQSQLETQNRRLRRQIQITEIIRRVDRSLVGASSRDEVESAVCERLVESDDAAFAWIGALDEQGAELVPRTWAGIGHEYLDAISLSTSSETPDPAVQTAVSGDPTVVESIVEGVTTEHWRKHALVWQFSSAIAVPLELDEYSYGVLAVYGTEPGAFGDLERSVLQDLGGTIANAINAVEARRALYADEFVELRLRLEEEADFLGQLAAASGARVEYVGLATHGEHESRLFFETSGVAAETVRDALEDLHSVVEFRRIGEAEEPTLFEATVAGTVLAASLVGRGGVPRSMVASGGDLSVVVDVPTTTEVREFLDMLRERYSSVQLIGRRNVRRDVQTRQELVAGLFDELTERQLEVLRTAFFAGFFEWPRESTGEDVAELLDVSQPTVNRHLRHALAALLQVMFEEEPTAIAPA